MWLKLESGIAALIEALLAHRTRAWAGMHIPATTWPPAQGRHHVSEAAVVDDAPRKVTVPTQTANFFANPSGRRLSYSSNGWWIQGLVGSIST